MKQTTFEEDSRRKLTRRSLFGNLNSNPDSRVAESNEFQPSPKHVEEYRLVVSLIGSYTGQRSLTLEKGLGIEENPVKQLMTSNGNNQVAMKKMLNIPVV